MIDSESKVLTRRTLLRSTAGICAAVTIPALATRANATPRIGYDLFVDPARGDDTFDGRRPRARSAGNGPVRSLEKALALARTAATIWLRGGTYHRQSPLVVPGPIRLAAYPDEKPIVSGAEEITGWRATTVNGCRAWTTTVPADWEFRQLYVNGVRRSRPRLPESVSEVIDGGRSVDDVGKYFFLTQSSAAGADGRTFGFADGDIDPGWHNLHDVDVVNIRDWFDERAPISAVDPVAATCTIAFRPYAGKAWPDLFYYVENVFEALRRPGQWYRDSVSNEVFYLPLPGERLGQVSISAPRTRELLRVEGSADNPVRNVVVDGVNFAHTEWEYYTQVAQSASQAGGAVVFTNAMDCALTRCTVDTVGEYGISLDANCQRVHVVGCEITDTGAGGIKIGSSTDTSPNGGHVITDNHIHRTGKVFHMGAGILAMDTYGNTIAHNHIHDLFYTGISVGWNWGFAATHAHDNMIEQNHIHHLGKGMLSDLGCIYTLGIQSGTVVRNNYVHDVVGYTGAPAAGLYADEGSSHIVWENNVVTATTPGFNLNYGADNTVRNNVVALTGHAAVSAGSDNRGGVSPYSLLLSHNILMVDDTQIFLGVATTGTPTIRSDDNLLWNVAGQIGDVDLSMPQPLKIVRAEDEQDVAGAQASVVLGDVTAGTFAFADLAAPVTLAANTRYYILAEVSAGGPTWYNPTPVQTTPVAAAAGPVYLADSGHYVFDPGNGSFGPLNFRYTTPGNSQQQVYVTGITLGGAMRSDYSGFVGLAVDVGSTPITVTALGRLRTASWWDGWQAAGLDTHSVVADPRFRNPRRQDFRLRGDSPALRPPVSFQPINLDDIGPRR